MKDEKIIFQMVEHHKKKEIKKRGKIEITWWQLSLIGIGYITFSALASFRNGTFFLWPTYYQCCF